MALNRPAISRFIEHFEAQLTDIVAIQSPTLQKIVIFTAFDPLARSAYGNIRHRVRIVRAIDELANWPLKTKVSPPQLSLALKKAKRSNYRLARNVRERLKAWSPGHLISARESPEMDEFMTIAAPHEKEVLIRCRYPELLYTYRNNLVHEFREPGYGVEWSTDPDEAYYTSMIDNPWQLVFPKDLLVALYKQLLVGLKAHLERERINPYDQFEFGSLWLTK